MLVAPSRARSPRGSQKMLRDPASVVALDKFRLTGKLPSGAVIHSVGCRRSAMTRSPRGSSNFQRLSRMARHRIFALALAHNQRQNFNCKEVYYWFHEVSERCLFGSRGVSGRFNLIKSGTDLVV